jgi:hypothetical protein
MFEFDVSLWLKVTDIYGNWLWHALGVLSFQQIEIGFSIFSCENIIHQILDNIKEWCFFMIIG